MSAKDLASVFLEELPALKDESPRDVLETTLREAIATAKKTWALVSISDERFVRHWARQAAKLHGSRNSWSQLATTDLYLALACSDGDVAALTAFRRELVPHIVPILRRVDASETFVDERVQELCERVLVANEGQTPRILEYAGQGPLEHWLRAIAMRLALNARRTQRRAPPQEPDDALLNVAGPSWEPSLEIMRERYGRELKQCLQSAMQRLDSKDRNVLHLHFVEGLSLNQIGAVYQTNKSTVSRWMSRARQRVLEDARDELKGRLQLPLPDLESIWRALGPQVDLSISRVLRSVDD